MPTLFSGDMQNMKEGTPENGLLNLFEKIMAQLDLQNLCLQLNHIDAYLSDFADNLYGEQGLWSGLRMRRDDQRLCSPFMP